MEIPAFSPCTVAVLKTHKQRAYEYIRDGPIYHGLSGACRSEKREKKGGVDLEGEYEGDALTLASFQRLQ